MIGSNGKIIKLDEKDRAGPPKQLKSQLLTTSTKSRRFVKWLLLACARLEWLLLARVRQPVHGHVPVRRRPETGYALPACIS